MTASHNDPHVRNTTSWQHHHKVTSKDASARVAEAHAARQKNCGGANVVRSRQIDFDAVPLGTYLNTGRPAQAGLRFNRFCYDLRDPTNRGAFQNDPEACMASHALNPEDRALVRDRDWLGLIRRGANVFVLLRLAQLCGDGLVETGARMRGETVEQYLASRRGLKGS
jgi:protocatechuate 4,5-dioxygenase alpha chain